MTGRFEIPWTAPHSRREQDLRDNRFQQRVGAAHSGSTHAAAHPGGGANHNGGATG